MKRNYLRLICCTMIVSMMILCLPSTNYPQEGDKQLITSIVLKITTPKGHWAKSSIAEGEMITIVNESTGVGYGFVPFVRSLESHSVEVKTFQVAQKASKVEALKEIESTEIKVGAQQQIGSISFEIKVLAITKDFKDQNVPSDSAGKPPDARVGCCIRCFGETICAGCLVDTDCGCCCGGSCCTMCKQTN